MLNYLCIQNVMRVWERELHKLIGYTVHRTREVVANSGFQIDHSGESHFDSCLGGLRRNED